MKQLTPAQILPAILALALVASVFHFSARSGFAQAQSSAPSSAQTSTQTSAQSSQPASSESKTDPHKNTKDGNPASDPKGFGGELAQQTREATGAEEEENSDLKHSSMVQMLARKTGLSVHNAHLLALSLNFAVIVIIVIWAARKILPGIFRNRSEAIQQALAEARAASQDANRRLADIENRLRELDVEIGQMQQSAEKEANAEDERIAKSAEEDIRKVVLSAKQEIDSAAKQARRELSNHTTDLAIALARAQVSVDPNTDQLLVRTFASHLTVDDTTHGDGNGGKDGH